MMPTRTGQPLGSSGAWPRRGEVSSRALSAPDPVMANAAERSTRKCRSPPGVTDTGHELPVSPSLAGSNACT